LLAYRASGGSHDVTADLNEYLREISGADFTVKDFRTWNATVLAAVGLAVSEHADSDAPRRRVIARVVREVYLGNTPAVARSSCIDPRVVERYQEADTIARVLGELGASTEFGDLATQRKGEAAVLRLLVGQSQRGNSLDARSAAAECAWLNWRCGTARAGHRQRHHHARQARRCVRSGISRSRPSFPASNCPNVTRRGERARPMSPGRLVRTEWWSFPCD
jgi:Eukaryotic DNA topoisomerase I, catalytic core